jgi:hypothetical protein
VASQLPSVLDQASSLQILVLVLVLLWDTLGVVLGRELEAPEVEALERLDHPSVIVDLLEGVAQLLDHCRSMPFGPARPNGELKSHS